MKTGYAILCNRYNENRGFCYMLSHYIDSILQAGKVAFTSNEAVKALSISKQAFRMAALRLKRKGALISPYRDLYIPVPPEYRAIGCLPANQLLPPLMKHISIPYYACLLTAAALHGAAHQRPQITQVMVSKRIRSIQIGDVVIRFIYKKSILETPIQDFSVRTGYLKVSTPEATIMDLLLYTRQSGGIQHVATLLAELMENINNEALLELAKKSKQAAWVQRLGALLELLPLGDFEQEIKVLSDLLSEHIEKINPSYVALSSGHIKGYPRNNKWRVIMNTDIESDI